MITSVVKWFELHGLCSGLYCMPDFGLNATTICL